MKTHLAFLKTFREELPPEFRGDDVRYPEALAEHFIGEYTLAGELVFDPFAGYGTTLLAAEQMGRIGYGVELNALKAGYIRSRLKRPQNLILGDARQLHTLDLPTMDFCMTSPPYMGIDDAEDPLTDCTTPSKGYSAYLHDLRMVFSHLRAIVKPAGMVVIEVSNLKEAGRVSTLAWDLASEVSKVLHFDGEVVICWDEYGYGYDHSYCLVYSVL